MLIEYPDPNERKRELARLIGIEDRMFVEVEGQPRIYAIADEDLDRENAEKTRPFTSCASSSRRRRDAVRRASVKLGCDHTNYPAHMVIAPETLASLAGISASAAVRPRGGRLFRRPAGRPRPAANSASPSTL